MRLQERYYNFCVSQPEMPVFLQAWWVEAATVGKHWNVFLYEENGKILASYVFHYVKKFGLKFILNPQLTQISGLWIDYQAITAHTCNENAHKRLSFEKKVMNYFIEKLENEHFAYLEQKFHFSITNWQPFYWKNFKQTTHYTFRIEDLTDLEKVLDSFSYSKRTRITNETSFFVQEMNGVEFYEFHKKCLLQKNKKISYSKSFFVELSKRFTEKEQGKIFAMKDENSKIHCAILLVWDKKSAYNLMTAIDEQYKASRASTKMFWEAIKFVADKTQAFDFEGSMIEGVADSFAQFGTQQMPYFQISKCNSKLFSIYRFFKK